MGFTFWESPVFPGMFVTAYVLAVPFIAVGALQTHSLSDAFRCLFSAVSAPILEMQAPIWSACRALWYFFYIIPHTSDFFQTVYTCSPNYTQDNIQYFYRITSNIKMNFANLKISRRMHKLKEIGKTLGLVSEFYSSNVSIFTTIFSNQILKQNSRDFDESNFENVNLVSIYQQFKVNYIQLPSVGESWEVSLKFQFFAEMVLHIFWTPQHVRKKKSLSKWLRWWCSHATHRKASRCELEVFGGSHSLA